VAKDDLGATVDVAAHGGKRNFEVIHGTHSESLPQKVVKCRPSGGAQHDPAEPRPVDRSEKRLHLGSTHAARVKRSNDGPHRRSGDRRHLDAVFFEALQDADVGETFGSTTSERKRNSRFNHDRSVAETQMRDTPARPVRSRGSRRWAGGRVETKIPGEAPGIFCAEFLMRKGTESVLLDLDLDRPRLRLLALGQGEGHFTVRESGFDLVYVH